ncbi:3-ketoacyl-CoA synthase 11 [Dichanthelium oligosanthes]|uniref:3-ketoacyl-CoA synthase n=1 Tax=Dichanthelium oligosanthes TaxID=888268 RepID=A0A1E5WLF1_9POAL|nr:3-ketoacyl-CoA synthase 11 [Dichanthelium oligosanthes]
MASHHRSIAMDSRELFRTVRQATLNHARLLNHRLVARLPHLLAVTLLVAVAQLVSPASLAGCRALRDSARANAGLVAAACAGVAAAAYAYAASRPRPVYLVDLAGYKPGRAHEATRAGSIRHFAEAGRFTDESIAFQARMLERAGVGEATHFPKSLLTVPVDMCLRAAREESEAVVFGAVDDVLARTGVRAEDIGVVIVNSSLFSPTPSFTSLVVNRYGLRHDVVTHNLSGMGCSAGIIAIDLAKHLLQVHPDTYALVVSTENITLNAYRGNHRSMLVTNTLFRMGGAAVLLSNRRADRRRAKYQLVHTVRTHRGGASDRSYGCVTQEEDAEGHVGVSLSKELMSVAGEALRTNITTLGPLVLPLSEQLRFLAAVLLKRVLRADVKPYMPDFKLALEHFCIHAGGRGVLDELERSLNLSAWHMEPSRMTLYRFGNTSSSSLWYELAYCEAKGRIKKGDRVWQIAFGSGFKCNSAVWKALRTVDDAGETNPWAAEIDHFPVHVPKVAPLESVSDHAPPKDGGHTA